MYESSEGHNNLKLNSLRYHIGCFDRAVDVGSAENLANERRNKLKILFQKPAATMKLVTQT